MSELKLFKIKAKVSSVNVRQELHGDEHRLACDIGIEFNQSNNFLDKLDSRLLETFYWKNPAGVNEQAQLDGIERVTDFPNLRFEHLGLPVKWNDKFDDGEFRVHHGDDDSNDIVEREVKINEIRLTPKEGGTVTVGMRIQCHPDEADLARLCTVLQSEVTVTVDSDPDDDQAELPEVASSPTAKKTPKKVSHIGSKERAQEIADAMTAGAGT